MDINKLLGKKIKALRAVKNMTQAELAEKADLSEDFIGRVERGISSPTIESLKKISDGLNISLKDLLEFDGGDRTDREILIKFMGLLQTRSSEDIEMAYDIIRRIIQRIDKIKPPD